MKRAHFAFAAGLLLLSLGAPAGAKPKKKRPVWPVPNPTLNQPGFQPSSSNRQISGVFGPRLKFGSARYDHHEGIDFYAFFDKGLPRGDHSVFSVLDGVVTDVIAPGNPERTETGNKVVVTHPIPWSALGAPKEWGNVRTGYLHLSRISVKKGQPVKAGDELGKAGETGYTSTVHLHFNVYRAGGRDVNVNPARIFTPKLFKGVVLPVHKKTVQVEFLERDKGAGTALARVYLERNVYGLDGFAWQVDKDSSRVISFEHVTATMRQKRDTGDQGLIPGLRLFPLRYNGGEALERLNAKRIPSSWPVSRYPVPNGQGVRLGYDVLATGVPADAKKLTLVVFSVFGKKVKAVAKRFKVER